MSTKELFLSDGSEWLTDWLTIHLCVEPGTPRATESLGTLLACPSAPQRLCSDPDCDGAFMCCLSGGQLTTVEMENLTFLSYTTKWRTAIC